MTDRKKDEPIIELTDVVEEGPGPTAEGKKETAPLPAVERKRAEPPTLPKKESSGPAWDLKGIPDSPLKKFILAEEEPAPPEAPTPAEKPLGFSPSSPKPPQPSLETPRRNFDLPRRAPEPPRPAPEPPRRVPEPPRPAPEVSRPVAEPPRRVPEPPRPVAEAPRPAPEVSRPVAEPPRRAPEPLRPVAEPPRLAPEPPRPSLPSIDAEMRTLRETILARVDKWVAQDGVEVMERVAREIFPKIAEDMIRKEIERLKAEAEEKE